MQNLSVSLPVVTKEMVKNPTIEQIVKGACIMVEQKGAQLSCEFNSAVRIAVDILESVEDSFEALLHYYIYRSEEVVMPFSVQHRFFCELSECFPVLENHDDVDSIMDKVFELIGDHIELIFKTIVLLQVAEGNARFIEEVEPSACSN